MWMQMAERSSTPGGPWRMGGLGFGLPLSRLYARYFGACPTSVLASLQAHDSRLQLWPLMLHKLSPLRSGICVLAHTAQVVWQDGCLEACPGMQATMAGPYGRSAHRHCVHAGGDLKLVSMPGYGVDAFLTMQHLEGDWQEQEVEPQVGMVGGSAQLTQL